MTCDGTHHTAHSFRGSEVQCRCFCQDPEYVQRGFSEKIYRQYGGVFAFGLDNGNQQAVLPGKVMSQLSEAQAHVADLRTAMRTIGDILVDGAFPVERRVDQALGILRMYGCEPAQKKKPAPPSRIALTGTSGPAA